MSDQRSVRCRQIGEADLPGVAELLARGFPARKQSYWANGLDRLARREVPASFPQFGYLLEADGVPVGVLLLIFTAMTVGGTESVRCNLSSWYVDPAFRAHASMLSMIALRHKGATFLNASPAPNTRPIIEAQGFRRYSGGQIVAVPALMRSAPGLWVEQVRAGAVGADASALPGAKLLADHAGYGCLSLVGHAPDGLHPFVFLPLRGRQGRLRLPGVQLVYCGSIEAFARFGGPIGRFLLARGIPFVVLDAEQPLEGVPGYFWKGRAPKYFKGPDRPRIGDLAYTEFVIFGP